MRSKWFSSVQSTIGGKENIEKWSKGTVNSTQEKRETSDKWKTLVAVIWWCDWGWEKIEEDWRQKRKRNGKNLRDQLMSWRTELRDNRKITSEKSNTIMIQSLRKVVDEMKIKI